jgi:aminomethyltransferase
MKVTALQSTHEALGAKMIPFAGFMMPVQYEGVNAEHETVRNNLGVFDVSHMGEFLIEGPNALELIQSVSSNDASKLTVGKAQYSCLPNNQGGIVDDLILYKIKEDSYLLVVNASNIEKDWEWISSKNSMGAEMKNISDAYSLLAIQGPKAVEAMQALTSVDLSSIAFYNFMVADFAGIEHVIISATGYTGSGGFEIYCKNSEVKQVWDKVLEAGFCLYGNDIDDHSSPIEAGLGWITKFNKHFTNSEALKKEKEEGPKRRLVGFELLERGIPRKDYTIENASGNEIGIVTSGTMAPSLGKGIGMGYVLSNHACIESEIRIAIRKQKVRAKIVKLPFYKK